MGRRKKLIRPRNLFTKIGIKARKRFERKKKEEAKRLLKFKKMQLKTKKYEARETAKAVAKIRKKTKIEYN